MPTALEIGKMVKMMRNFSLKHELFPERIKTIDWVTCPSENMLFNNQSKFIAKFSFLLGTIPYGMSSQFLFNLKMLITKYLASFCSMLSLMVIYQNDWVYMKCLCKLQHHSFRHNKTVTIIKGLKTFVTVNNSTSYINVGPNK